MDTFIELLIHLPLCLLSCVIVHKAEHWLKHRKEKLNSRKQVDDAHPRSAYY